MNRFRKMLLSAAVCVLFSFGAAAAEKLRIGTEGAYPPFNLINASGQVVGFDLEIAQALCAKMEVECEVVTADWEGIVEALNAGEFDFLAASMSVTDERSNAVDFTEHYYTNKLRFVASKSVDLDALEGKVIGAQRATVASAWLEDNLGAVVEIRLYDTQENAWLDLAAGHVDGILADAFVHWEWLKSEAGAGFEFKGEAVFDNDKIAMAVRKGNDELRARLNRALAQIIADGTYTQIRSKYFPFDIY